VLLCGCSLHADNNNNVAYYNNATFNKQMIQASLLSGAARYKAYGNLDVGIFAKDPPWAAYANINQRLLLSSRVGCFTFNATYTLDLAAVCLK